MKKRYSGWGGKDYETDVLVEYLEKMASRGWFLEKMMESGLMRFRRGEPQKQRYAVAFVPGSSVFESGDRESAVRIRECWEEAGWQFVCASYRWQIFCSREKLEPLETDEAARLESMKKMVFSRSRLLSLAFLAAIFGAVLYLAWRDAAWAVASNMTVVGSLYIAVWMAFLAGDLALDFRWFQKAEKAVKIGEETPKTSLQRVRLRTAFWLVFALMFLIFMAARWAGGVGFLLHFGRIWVGILIAGWILYAVRERWNGKKTGKVALYIGVSCAVLMAWFFLFDTVFGRLDVETGERETAFYPETEAPDPLSLLGYDTGDLPVLKETESFLGRFVNARGNVYPNSKETLSVDVRYYSTPQEWAVKRTVKTVYPPDQGNDWKVMETRRLSDGKTMVIKYEYEPRAEGASDPDKGWTVYLCYGEREILSVKFYNHREDDRLLEAMARCAGSYGADSLH